MTTNFLHGPEVIELEDQPRPVTLVRSSVIHLVGTSLKLGAPVNKNVLVAGAPVLGEQVFGHVDQGGSIPRALDGIFDVHGAVVIVVNVLDPSREDHLTDVVAADLNIGRFRRVMVPHDGVQPDTLVVKAQGGATTYAVGTDFTFDPDTKVIQILASGSIPLNATKLNVAYTRLDDSKVTIDDIIGGVFDGQYKGVHTALAAESEVGFPPKILLAPGWTHLLPDGGGNATANPVVAEMLGIAERLRAWIPKDTAGNTDAEAIQDRENWGSRRVHLVGDHLLVRRKEGYVAEPKSPRVAGLASKIHAEKGFWWSISNQLLGSGVVGLTRPMQFSLGDQNSQANLLNEKECAVTVRHEGFRHWGNRTCSDDPKYAFLSVVITNDIIAESLLRAHLWAIDRCMDKRYFEIVPEGVNGFLNLLEQQGAILGGECWVVPELNSPQSIQSGHAWFDYEFTPPFPSERVTFRAHLTGKYIVNIIPRDNRAVLDPTVV